MTKESITLVEQTQKDILKYISEHSDSPTLPKEEEMAELLGVSRIVIREALSSLRVLGIIETKRKRGTIVTQPDIFGVLKMILSSGILDIDTLRDLYQLRLMLEIGMADFVFKYKTDKQMEELDEIVSREATLEEQLNKSEDQEEIRRIAEELKNTDIEFHTTLFKMTGNNSLVDFQGILRHLFNLYRPRGKRDFHTHTIVSHIGLYNLLRNGTPDAFRMGMRLHLTRQFTDMENILQKTLDK